VGALGASEEALEGKRGEWGVVVCGKPRVEGCRFMGDQGGEEPGHL
jgi:hypothetical protein